MTRLNAGDNRSGKIDERKYKVRQVHTRVIRVSIQSDSLTDDSSTCLDHRRRNFFLRK